MAESEDPDATFIPSIDWPLHVTLKEARSWWMHCLEFRFSDSGMSPDILTACTCGFWHAPAGKSRGPTASEPKCCHNLIFRVALKVQ